MSVRSRVRRAHREEQELNITAFMNLMVVLVPFLLISAVFSQVSILELILPPDSNPQVQQQNEDVNFEVIVRDSEIIVADTRGGVIQKFAKQAGEYDYKALSGILKTVKARFPEKRNITLLLEPAVPYDVLVQTMDAVRTTSTAEGGAIVRHELFPQVAIGDAP